MLKKIAFISRIILILILPLTACSGKGVRTIEVHNPGFEEGTSTEAKYWTTWAWDTHAGVTEFRIDDKVSRTGSRSAQIISNSPNDARYRQEIAVEGDRMYRLSCWIKTENVGNSAKGANLSVEGITDTTADVKGTSVWEQVTLYGRTKQGQKSIILTLGLGGYGSLNTGKAWFDDVSFQEIRKLPEGAVAVNLFAEESAKTEGGSPPEAGQTQSQVWKSNYNVALLSYAGFYALAVFAMFHLIRKNMFTVAQGREKLYLYCLLASAFLFRILTATAIEGWPNDIATNKAWALSAAANLTNFYKSGWSDYPPLMIYVLFVIGKITGISGTGDVFTLLIKLPSIVADIVTSYLIYSMARKHFRVELALLLGGIYAFHPAVYVDSTVWGQVDSIFTLIVVMALKLLVEGKIKLSSAFFAASILMKPQGIFFLPVLLFELIKGRSLRDFASAALSALAAAIIIVLPFAAGQEPLWIFKLYLSTAGEYPSAVMNAFNFFGLLGANFKDGSSTLFIFSYNTWGIIFDIFILASAAHLYFRSRHKVAPVICAIVLGAGAFIFSTKMHERYMFPVIALILMALIYSNDRRMLILLAGFSTTIFFNIHVLFSRMLVYGVVGAHMVGQGTYPIVLVFSLANVLFYIYLAKVSFDILIRGKLVPSGIG